jgi:hypothetical protein
MASSRSVSGLVLAAALVWTVSDVAAEKPQTKLGPDSLSVRTTVTRTDVPGSSRRPASRRGAGVVEGVGGGNAWFVVESAFADFGEMLPEQLRELPGAFVIRVHSDRDWELRLVPLGDLDVIGTADRVPLDRLSLRSPASPGYSSFASLAPVTIGIGGPTGGTGTLVDVDLRLELRDEDPLGRYGVDFRALLEVR